MKVLFFPKEKALLPLDPPAATATVLRFSHHDHQSENLLKHYSVMGVAPLWIPENYHYPYANLFVLLQHGLRDRARVDAALCLTGEDGPEEMESSSEHAHCPRTAVCTGYTPLNHKERVLPAE